MIILKVPYAEKDQAKALGARWNSARKVWYVPDGQAAAPFERWLDASQQGQSTAKVAGTGKHKVDSYEGELVIGVRYVALDHDCNPFLECPVCLPVLQSSGWKAAHDSALANLALIRAGKTR